MKNDICQGCKTVSCMFIIRSHEEICPCNNCLVKVICDQWCDKRMDATNIAFDNEVFSYSWPTKESEEIVKY
jgi:hypothetical protein